MHKTGRFSLAFIAVCVLLLAACASKTPTQRVAESRAAYKASLNSFFVKETPLAVEVALDPDAEGEESAGEPAAESTAEGEEMLEPMEPEVRQDAVLDVIVQHDTANPLAGLTLDVSMVDESGNEVEHWRYWIETGGLPKANQRPYSVVFEDVDYKEGYGFHVEVRSPVSEADRGAYREFDGL